MRSRAGSPERRGELSTFRRMGASTNFARKPDVKLKTAAINNTLIQLPVPAASTLAIGTTRDDVPFAV